MRWFFTRSAALPVKLVLLAWLLYATVVAALGALVKVAAAAKVSMAVLGLLATAVIFPILFAVIVAGVVAYAAPLVAVPRLWQQQRSRAKNVALTVGLVVGSGLAGDVLGAAAARTIGRDRFRALVWKYRSNASARVIVGVDAAAGSTGGGVLQRVECVLRLSHGTAAPGLTSARCHPNVPAVMDASFCRRRRVLVASVFLFFVLGGCAGLRFSA